MASSSKVVGAAALTRHRSRSLGCAWWLAVTLVLLSTCLAPTHAWRTGQVKPGLPDSIRLEDVTTTAFSTSSGSLVLSQSLRVLTQGDWFNTRRTSFLVTQASDSNHGVLQLWQNKGDNEALQRVWSSAPLPAIPSNTTTTTAASSTAPYIVSAVCADTLTRGVLDVIVQGSNGRLFFLDGTVLRLGAEGQLPSSGDAILQPLTFSPNEHGDAVDATLKDPTAPVLSLASVYSPCGAPDIVFVNPANQVVVVSSLTRMAVTSTNALCSFANISAAASMLSATQGSVLPKLVANYLFQNNTEFVWRASTTQSLSNYTTYATLSATASTALAVHDMFSLASQDVNEDCSAELLFTVSGFVPEEDTAEDSASVVYLAAYSPSTKAVTLFLPLPKTTTDAAAAQALTYGTPLVVDINGDGVSDLVIPVRLAVDDASVPSGFFRRLQIFFNTRGETTAFLGANCAVDTLTASAKVLLGADLYGADTSSTPIFTAEHSTLYTFDTTVCGVASQSVTNAAPLFFSQLESAPSRAHVPLLLRTGDINRDHLLDLLVPTNYGPLVLSSSDTSAGSSSSAPFRTSLDTHGFYCTQLDSSRADHIASSTSAQDADTWQYQYGTPFFASLGDTPGQLNVVLSSLDPLMSASLTGSATTISAVTRVYRVTNTPLQRYFMLLADITNEAIEMTAVAAWNSSLPNRAEVWKSWAKQVPYGALQVGAVHRLGWQDTHMTEHWAMITQGARTVGHDLGLPRPLLGLGSTFSYVHDYTVGAVVDEYAVPLDVLSPQARGVHKAWPSYLVPNSQIFAVQAPLTKPSKWSLKLYLPTSQYRTLLLVTLIVILIVLGIPIACLRWSEIRSDYKDWHNRI